MPKRFTYILLALFPSATFGVEQENQWPYDIVPTSSYLGLTGHPKKMEIYTELNSSGKPVETYEFYEDGVLKELRSNSIKQGISVKRGKRGEVKEVMHTSLEHGNAGNATIFRPKKHDGNGRVILIVSESRSTDNVKFSPGGVGAKLINYSASVITYDAYYRHSNGIIGPLNRERIEIEGAGKVLAICWGGDVSQPCDRSEPIKEFGDFGIVRYATGKSESTYIYKDKQLAKEIRMERDSQGKQSSLKYAEYEVDECGNWVSRAVIYEDELNPQSYIEKRKIIYHTSCKN